METIIAFFNENFWATATILASMSTSLTGVVNHLLNPNRIWKQVIAWLISIALTIGGYFLNVITVADPIWLTLTLTGVFVGLASNGIYEIPVIKKWVQSWLPYKEAKKDVE